MMYGEWLKCPDNVEPDENESALSGLYRKLWQWFPGRPWTYVIRDWWHRYPLLWFFALLILGSCLGHLWW